ncbi:hypothetical protein K1T71_002927 [Dendrolimus kikuchii]|uniref:Uncharacterized protein n=1 Tax=Dendrolimus kikuchii TaxID=765133 RepID=A0ACC1DAF1_9NEOP|nr:hypothetical protein K1T71_002927 [Dendrolimus kikuchii]
MQVNEYTKTANANVEDIAGDRLSYNLAVDRNCLVSIVWVRKPGSGLRCPGK